MGRGWRCPTRPSAQAATGPTARRDCATGVIDAGGGQAENDYENEERERWEAGAGAATCQPAGFTLKIGDGLVVAMLSFACGTPGSCAAGLRAASGFAVRGLWLAGRGDGFGQQRRRLVGRVFAGRESGVVRNGRAPAGVGTTARVSGGFVEPARGREEQKPVSATGDFGRAGRALCSMNVRQGC